MKSEINPEVVAAVDLGSNSFHMIVARLDNGQFQVLDRIKEMVRLRGGLDKEGILDSEVRQAALDCLNRFGQRLANIPRGGVRAVGTNTLRNMRHSFSFLREAQQALGHPVEIISGAEEARLIYLGVSRSLAEGEERRLVIDIGGGSTEMIIGRGFEPLNKESLEMGCVSMTQRFFSDGEFSRRLWKQAEVAARLLVKPYEDDYRVGNWVAAIGSSGSVRAAAEVIRELGHCKFGVNRAGLEAIKEQVITAGSLKNLDLPGLTDERKPVFAGGCVVLLALFKALNIDGMTVSEGSLREGLLYELAGRIRHEDIRETTVLNLQQRFGVRTNQADRVAAMTAALFSQVESQFDFSEDAEEILSWAARLHEIGLSINHSGFHKHGAYLIEYLDMPGFSRREQLIMAVLLATQRKKFSAHKFDHLPSLLHDEVRRMSIILRLAILLHRDRVDDDNTLPLLDLHGDTLELEFMLGWLEAHPLTETDLQQERKYLKSAGFKLTVKE